jgi:biotin transport system substrate-specific component
MSSFANLITPGTAYVPLRLAGRPLAQKAIVVALGVAFLTASSWVQVVQVPVPITMQTFAVLMVGALCGWRLGATTVFAWLALALRYPLLAEFKTLWMAPYTAGYLASFPIMAAFVGWMAERGWTARPVPALLTLLVAEAICFALGVGYLAQLIGLDKAIAGGLLPFWFSDLVKTLLAVAVITAARRATPTKA